MGGMRDFVEMPVKGMRENGGVGFIQGLATGMTSVVTKPVGGILGLAANATEGAMATPMAMMRGTQNGWHRAHAAHPAADAHAAAGELHAAAESVIVTFDVAELPFDLEPNPVQDCQAYAAIGDLRPLSGAVNGSIIETAVSLEALSTGMALVAVQGRSVIGTRFAGVMAAVLSERRPIMLSFAHSSVVPILHAHEHEHEHGLDQFTEVEPEPTLQTQASRSPEPELQPAPARPRSPAEDTDAPEVALECLAAQLQEDVSWLSVQSVAALQSHPAFIFHTWMWAEVPSRPVQPKALERLALCWPCTV